MQMQHCATHMLKIVYPENIVSFDSQFRVRLRRYENLVSPVNLIGICCWEKVFHFSRKLQSNLTNAQ